MYEYNPAVSVQLTTRKACPLGDVALACRLKRWSGILQLRRQR